MKHYLPEIVDGKFQLFQQNPLPSEKEIIEIRDVKQLDDLLGYEKISISEIHSAIENNTAIETKYKYLIYDFLDNLTSKYSNLDLRIFYENIKSIKINMVSSDYFDNTNEKNLAGSYNSILNQIIILDDDEEIFIHELSHTLDLYYIETEEAIICRAPLEKGRALNEAMTNVTASCTLEMHTYDKYGAVLKYLRNMVDFDYNTYNQKGIWYLIELLHEKYPDVDIDYIVSVLDTMNETEINGQYIYLDSSPELLEELFKIYEIELARNPENYYDLFLNFIEILYYTMDWRLQNSAVISNYVEKYNQLLIKKDNYTNLITEEEVLNFFYNYMNEKNLNNNIETWYRQ